MALLTNLDADQVVRNSHDETNQATRVHIVAGSTTQLDKVDSPTFTAGTSINGSAGAWVELKASTAAAIKQLHVFDTGGKFLNIAVGAAASEVVECTVGPGNDQPINVNIPSGSRVSIRSAETTAPSAGSVAINYLG